MHFGFTEEQLMIQDVARRIAQEKIAPSAEHHDRTAEFPLENIRLLGENGLMGIEVPAEYGGAGMDPIAYVPVSYTHLDVYKRQHHNRRARRAHLPCSTRRPGVPGGNRPG